MSQREAHLWLAWFALMFVVFGFILGLAVASL